MADGRNRGEQGSVLMETILVLPLYLMLLGGMFVIGELLLGRYLAHDIERTVAWRAADRFGPDFNDGIFDYATGPNGVFPGMYMQLRGKEEGYWRNNWLFTVGGRSDVVVGTPWWSNFVNVQGVMTGKGKDEAFEEKFLLNSSDGKFLDEPRVWVFRRQQNLGIREAGAGELPWVGIAYDHFPGTDASVGAAPKPIMVPDYKRCPLAIVVSGDK